MNQKNILFFLLIAFFLQACGTARKTEKSSVRDKAAQELAAADIKARALFLDANKEKILGNYDESIRLFREVIKTNPENAAARYELARLLRLKDLPREALVFARESVRLDPSNPWYSLFLAELYGNLMAYPDQVKVYEDIVSKHPGNEDYMQLLARSQKRANFIDEAIKSYETIETRFGISEEIVIEIYSLYLKRKKTDKAIAAIQRLIDAYPWEARYKIILAETYIDEGEPGKARQVLEEGLTVDPGNPYLRLSMSSLYDREGQKEASKRELMAAFTHPELDITSKLEILRSSLIINQLFPDQQMDIYQMTKSLRETNPDDPQVLALLVDVLISMDSFADARETLIQLLSLDSSKYEAWEQLIRLDAHLEEHASLLEHADRALAMFPNMPTLYFLKGLGQFQLKQLKESAKTLETGLKFIVDQEDLKTDFHAFLGDVYHELADYSRSDQAYDAALKIKPDHANVLNNYSYYLTIRGEDLEKAARMAKRANEIDPGKSSYQDTYGWVFYQQGLYEEAEVWLRKALESGGNTSDVILEHYGDVMFKLGKKEEAIEYWSKAAEQGKGSTFLEKKLKEGILYE